ncbi:MAG: thiamine pyrophosphate-dependent dehydrogenase E1 component subunit alpha [Pirellulales bacterium]|nr:thiamine pyrophosphate-dependent dehydrogenase E1 component subunit alpha [Pirellulales bacterium]
MADSQYRVEDPQGGTRDRMVTRTADGRPTLHIPIAPHRPGDEPRYARFTQQPGDLERPDPLANFDLLHDHAHGLVRVLDDDGNAIGPWDPKLGATVLRDGLEWMLTTRHFDRRQMKMQRQGRLSFCLECKGEEAIGVAAGMVYAPEDLLFPSYRMQGIFLVRGMPMVQMMCHCIGNRGDISKGRQMPVHYGWKQGNLVSISSPVGTQFPQAVGAAMAMAYRHESRVAAAWLGDGTSSQGDFHHGLNFASVYLPPVVLQVVNNQWAISTHRNIATGGKTFSARAESYGIPGIRVDGNDFLAVYAVTAWAAERARHNGGPTLIELLTYRSGAHSTSDDPSRYRPDDESRLWPGGDPIARLARHLKNLDEWSDEQQENLENRLEKEVAMTYKQAETYGTFASGPFDPPETLFDDVYERLPHHLEEQRDEIRILGKN